ncbi:phosphotransferase enzyme family-domain-containing protein [Durotheca rogersii]|uniref:phosphotransferase enzyme family-domain-containing protein n=1 Tax=Durotheca rogersii TaxID=419775 RepID=UPI00221EE50A|nr:phosphotransferase enzyme family-domain-containing protein [Durotheca rogersii]KAI5859883.1 phosphotransferase enzyme family-domain-containing protein [Durotheca rogersii]
MATISHNHTHYQARLDYIKQILADYLNLPNQVIEQTKITPIQYEHDFPFKYNNFVYHLSLLTGVPGGLGDADGSRKLKHPGCVPIPAGTKDFILRLSNPDAEGMHQETRVQNEVGILTLASAALCHIKPTVVPRVFGWDGASRDHLGWILEELMPGVPLAEPFDKTMTFVQKREILAQMARLLKALQDYLLPESINGWGGVTFDGNSGAIVSTSMPSVGAGPWPSFEDSYRGRLKVALSKADTNPYLQGWHANGVRERVDAFIERGLAAQFSDLTSKHDRTIIHADFTTDNLLYDPTTGRITALLDYDFASILHPAYEFFRSFNSTGGRLSGWLSATTLEEKEAVALRNAKLTGQFPSPLPVAVASSNGPGVDWELARAWDEELQKLDVKRPSSIQGIDKIADVDEVLGTLLPWTLANADYLRLNPEEDHRMDLRRRSESKLVGLLDHMGF